jgi:zinc protease
MGYMINTVTQKAFNIQQNVVQNEKRQNVDNRPYGQTSWVIAKNLYPKGHPYSWTVIGEMEDLKNATVEDVKKFHSQYYLPNNATLVLAGDFDIAEAKKLIEKYFGEIPMGNPVTDPEPKPVTLEKTIKVYHEDNLAKASQLRMIWPTIEDYTDDSYPLSYLGELLSRGKKAPLYKVLEKEKKLSSSQNAYNGSQEIAGEFSIMVTANEGVSLKDVEAGVFDAFKMFEDESFTDADVERIKASLETDFYNSISSILSKSFQFASYNEDMGDPGYFTTNIKRLKAVTKADILRVYNKYIKDKPYLATSFVPKGMVGFVAEGSVKAAVVEENILNATEVKIDETAEEFIVKTPTKIDRSIQPTDGPDPLLSLPVVWDTKLSNGMKVFGIEQSELPLVQFNIKIKGGHYLDAPEKAGVASMVADLMMQGTKNKTPLELEEEIENLGARIYVSASNNDITLTVNTLARNYDKALALVEEILLEPRWDAEEFDLAKTKLLNGLKRNKANPTNLVRDEFNKLIYGESHIFAYDRRGTEETVEKITLDDLKAFYASKFSPSLAAFNISGDIAQEKVEKSLKSLNKKWQPKEVVFPQYALPAEVDASKIYFIDVPGAKQSVINIGNLSLARTDADYYPAQVMNYKLGGSFNGLVNLVLREEKGYTYGARTGFSGTDIPGSFSASTSVRSTATQESVQIFIDLMTKYRDGISDEDLQFTKDAMIKSNALKFETLGAQVGMLEEISMYNLPKDYVKILEDVVNKMDLIQHKALAQKYIDPLKMYYVIAGDVASQLDPLSEIGFGKPVLVEN